MSRPVVAWLLTVAEEKGDLIAFLESLTDDEFLNDARLAAP